MESYKEKGALQISRDAICAIAGACAGEVEGVAGIARRGPGGKKPVSVVLRENLLEISLGITLKHAAKIAETCTAVQQRVKDNVQTMTGMAVGKVNVKVSRVVFPGEKQQ